MRRLLIVTSLVLALTAVPSTAAHAGQGTHTHLFAGAGKAKLVVDPDTGTFTIDGKVLATPIGIASVHSDGQFTDANTFELSSTFTNAHGTVTTTTTGQTKDLANGDAKFKNHDQVTGGTGRYAGATGKSTTVGISHPKNDDGTVSRIVFVFVGSISY